MVILSMARRTFNFEFEHGDEVAACILRWMDPEKYVPDIDALNRV